MFEFIQSLTSRRLQPILDSMREGVLLTNPQGVILTVNRAFSKVTGYSSVDVRGQTPNLLQSGKHSSAFYRSMWQAILKNGYWEGEIYNRRKNGELYLEHLSISAVRDRAGRVTHYLGVFSDITEKKLSEEHLLQLAYHDHLTELPNRLLCIDRLKQAIAHARRRNSMVGLLYLDLDKFKAINDRFGHTTGDALLQAVVKRLKQFVREEDTIARLGGDEFAVILVDLESPRAAQVIQKAMINAIRRPFSIAGNLLSVNVSIGLSFYPKDARSPQRLFDLADQRMYRAKRLSRYVAPC